MAISNKDRISRTLDLLRDGLVPFVERELKAKLGASWQKAVDDSLRENLRQHADGSVAWTPSRCSRSWNSSGTACPAMCTAS